MYLSRKQYLWAGDNGSEPETVSLSRRHFLRLIDIVSGSESQRHHHHLRHRLRLRNTTVFVSVSVSVSMTHSPVSETPSPFQKHRLRFRDTPFPYRIQRLRLAETPSESRRHGLHLGTPSLSRGHHLYLWDTISVSKTPSPSRIYTVSVSDKPSFQWYCILLRLRDTVYNCLRDSVSDTSGSVLDKQPSVSVTPSPSYLFIY